MAGTIIDVLCIISMPYKGFCVSFHILWKKRSLGLNNTCCAGDFVKTKQAAGKSWENVDKNEATDRFTDLNNCAGFVLGKPS